MRVDLTELKRLAEAAELCSRIAGMMSDDALAFIEAASPAVVLELIERLEVRDKMIGGAAVALKAVNDERKGTARLTLEQLERVYQALKDAGDAHPELRDLLALNTLAAAIKEAKGNE